MDMSLVIGNGLLLLFVIIEVVVLIIFREEEIPWRDIVFNLNSGHILMWIFRGLEVSAYFMVLQYASLGLLDQTPYVFQWLFCFVVWDFCFYWLHRLHHKYPLLWAVHVIHHEGEHFNLSLGIRNSWYSSITSFPFFVGLAIIGIPLEIFIATSSIHYFIQFYNHNRLITKSGFLEKVLITPSHHRVHHGVNDEYIDRNFGGTFVIWDKLFGTFQPERNDIDIKYGTIDKFQTENIALSNNIPFIKLFGLQINLTKARKKLHFNDILIASGGLLLFMLLLYYISIENTWETNMKLGLFILVFFGTIANGGLSEGVKWGYYLWVVMFCLAFPAFITFTGILNTILTLLSILFALHGLTVLLFGIKQLGKGHSTKLAESEL